jgi:general secretion pathway protein F
LLAFTPGVNFVKQLSAGTRIRNFDKPEIVVQWHRSNPVTPFMPLANNKPLSFRIRAVLYAQLAQMETAGLPVDRALSIINLSSPLQTRVEAMRTMLKKGVEFALAGEKSGLFTKLEASLIRASTNAGSPARMYRRLADFATDRALQLSTMKSRLALPAFMFLAALFIQPIPLLVTGSLSGIGYLWQVLKPVLLIAAVIYGFRWWVSRDVRSKGKSLYQSLPLYGPIFVRRNLRDFFESLALMLEAGVSMLDALPAALDTVEDDDIKRDLAKIRPQIEKGGSLTDALRNVKYIDDERVIQFSQTGEASGTLPEMLMRHTKMETESINGFLEQLTMWAPRIIYGIVVLWMAYGLITGGGFMPRMPNDI